MGTKDESYKKVITILRNNYKEPQHPENLSARVMDMIDSRKPGEEFFIGIPALFFSWTSVGWVRRTMTIAALLLIALFAYQQFELIAGLRDLSVKLSGNTAGFEVKPAPSGGEYRSLLMLEGRLSSKDSIRVSVSDIQNLIESYEKLEESYEKIYRILQNNPELLKRLEKEFGKTIDNIDFKTKI